MSDLELLKKELYQFAKERNWERFHSPKNLTMALSNEVGELMELFQWLTESQSHEIMNDPKSAYLVKDELADVFLYLVRLADVLNVDLYSVAQEKLVLNQKRFPIDLKNGNSV